MFVKATATAAPPMRILVNVHKKNGFTKVLARPGLRESSFLSSSVGSYCFVNKDFCGIYFRIRGIKLSLPSECSVLVSRAAEIQREIFLIFILHFISSSKG